MSCCDKLLNQLTVIGEYSSHDEIEKNSVLTCILVMRINL